MGGLSIWHWLVVGIIVLLLFGKGRFSDMMGDVAKGIKSFKKGMTEEDDSAQSAASRPAPRLQQQPPLDPNPDQHLQPMQDDRPKS
ncbi:twin-arginine translocase TatA/TatE family subunit [Rhizorhabdus dicambivorans]|uniref:Sec-independent protein translocase protein TatA n=1 Tax=Rhizorhabdus dicambivorans TaxID=1850238 RepID=A0A2A4G1L0_9SPHN|nr:twin-arginine translocase TatA/TatE family subunit [Rhizorhabdus dicambivorans]ATE66635.1 twin-arginine translocase TatA/TatE family subunit [Rhizorhabdus dicambivorans]PCE43881.1 twin-arginine translocase TatA/TatE family subunit [Rhizorhabdus dicambivorans]